MNGPRKTEVILKGALRTPLLFAALTVSSALLVHSQILQRWDLVVYDLFQGLWTRPTAAEIRILAIDERSLDVLGRWPWPRRLHADLIRKLTAAGARVIALDILFAEADTQEPDGDRLLAAAMQQSGRVILPLLPGKDPLSGQMRVLRPLPMFAAAAADLGHVDAELDSDGIARGLFLEAGLGTPHWPAYPLAMYELGKGGLLHPLPGQRRESGEAPIPGTWVRDYRILIPFAGPPGHFPRISYVDVLSGRVDTSELSGKWVLVGVTAAGLGTTLPTPTSRHLQPMSGVEFNANVLDALMAGIWIEPMGQQGTLAVTLILVWAPLLVYRLPARRGSLPIWIGVLLTAPALSVVLLLEFHLWFAPASALLLTALGYPVWLGGRLGEVVRQSSAAQKRTAAPLATLEYGVIVTGVDGQVEYLNPAAESLCGYALAQVQGHPLKRFLELGTEGGPVPREAATATAERELLPRQGELKRRSGESIRVWISSKPIRDKLGGERGHVVSLHEAAAGPTAIQSSMGSPYVDPLTRLPNRALLAMQLQQHLARAARGGRELAVLFLNINRFRDINDRLGHAGGDRLLQAVATRLKRCVRESDLLARNGSDEFVVVIEDLAGGRSAAPIAGKLLEQLSRTYEIDGTKIDCDASVGISLYPQDGQDAETLLKNAYAALRLQRGEGNGEGSFRYFSEQMRRQIKERLELTARLRHALDRDELELHYQPQLDLAKGRITGAEALLRWRDEAGHLMPPGQFIPLAEDSGLIHAIGEWVFDAACRQLRCWQREGLTPLCLAVNISPVQLQGTSLLPQIRQSLSVHGMDPHFLELEVTESAIMNNLGEATAMLLEFRDLGGRISIDDFGTGYSSFNYLKQLPVDRIKIDRTFVRDMASVQDDAFITLSIIAMAHGLRLQVIAEGVETGEQLALLREQGCDLVQGFLIAQPLPPEAFARLVQEQASVGVPDNYRQTDA